MNELQKAQKAATEAKRKAARAAEAAETAAAVEAEKLEDAKRKETEARNGIIFERFESGVKAAIAAHLKTLARDTQYEITGAGNYFGVRQGPGVSISVRLIAENCGYSYSRTNGKWRAHAGDYGHRKQWPQRKDGSHNYDAIAEFIIYDLDRQHGFNVRHDKKQEHAKISDKLKTEFKLANAWRTEVTPTADPELPVCVSLKFTETCTAERARELLAIFDNAGLIER